MITYLRISLFKKIILAILGLFILTLATLFNPYGIPTFLKNKLLEQLHQYHISINCSNIVLSPWSGVVFKDIRGSYEIKEGTLFVQANQLAFKTNLAELAMNKQMVQSISLSGALASFYLKNHKEHFTINHATGTIVLHDSSIEVQHTKMVVDGIPLEVKGRILNVNYCCSTLEAKRPANEHHIQEALEETHFITQSLLEISPKLKKILNHIKQDQIKKNIAISFSVDINAPELALIKVDANFNNLHILHGTFQQVSLHSIYQQKEISIQKLELSSLKGEKISLSAHYHLDSQIIRGGADIEIYPQTVIETAQKLTTQDLSQFDLITARNKFKINLSLPSQKISKNPTLKGSAFAKDFTLYGDVFAENLETKATWKNNILYFDITKGKVNKNTDVACKGAWDLHNEIVMLTFQVVGNPYFAHHFIPPAGAKRGFTGTLDLFKWDDHLPPFINLSLRINYGKNFNLQLMGDIRASDISMNNLKFKNLSTQFEVISGDEYLGIAFNKVDARDSQDRTMLGSIFYTIPPGGDYGKLTIDATTEVPVDEILNAFKLETSFLDSMKNWDKFYAEVKGTYDIDNPDRSNLEVKGEADKLELYGVKIAKAVGTVQFKRGQVFVPRITGLIEGTPGFGGYFYDSNTGNAACYLNFKRMDFEQSSFNRKKNPIKGRLDLKADVGLRFLENSDIPNLSGQGNFTLHNTDSPLKIPYIGAIYSDLVGALSKGKWGKQLCTMKGDIYFRKHQIDIKDLKTDDDMMAINSSGTVFLAQKRVDFVVKALPVQNFLWKLIPAISSPFTNNATIRIQGPFDNIQWKTEFLKNK
jgi:hypothetical protein